MTHSAQTAEAWYRKSRKYKEVPVRLTLQLLHTISAIPPRLILQFSTVIIFNFSSFLKVPSLTMSPLMFQLL